MRPRVWFAVLCIVLCMHAVLPADTIKPNPAPKAPATDERGTPVAHDVVPPLDHPQWGILDPTLVGDDAGTTPTKPAPAGPSQLLPFVVLCGAILVAGALVAYSMRRWGSADVARYLQRTGSPWGRREDLFVEKLVLELRLHRAAELARHLALRERFDELDKVERPLRKLRSRFRAVRREYRHIARRIGPVTETVRQDCAQAIRRSGLTQAVVLSPQEEEALRRLTREIERKRRSLQPAS